MKKLIADVGVVVGRFQVPEFHEGHKYLLHFVYHRHPQTMVVLGVSAVSGIEDPFDFAIRSQMIRDMLPMAVVYAIVDEPDDKAWSDNLDSYIDNLFPNKTVLLYGGRSSFIEHYNGKHATEEIDEITSPSGTDIRQGIHCIPDSVDFRRGMVYALKHQYPRVNMTVDIAMVRCPSDPNAQPPEILMATKKNLNGFVFPGGFLSSNDKNLEHAAARELAEETGMYAAGGIGEFSYIGSFTIDDWRYRGRRDKIVTTLFTVPYCHGAPKAADDIDRVAWLDARLESLDAVADHHKPLFERVLRVLSR